jgi:hypothetical protein
MRSREASYWIEQAGSRGVFDLDGTREAARQRALPKREDLPPAQRRLDEICAPGSTGRKRGEVVRTRTVVSQANPLPVARQLREQRERGVPGGTGSRAQGHPSLPRCARSASSTCPAPIGWTLRNRGRPGGSGRFLLRDAGQGLHGVGSPGCASAATFASR